MQLWPQEIERVRELECSVLAEKIVVPGRGGVQLRIAVERSMREVAFDSQPGVFSHLDERVGWRVKNGCQGIDQHGALLLARQKSPAYSNKASDATLAKHPPQHLGDIVVTGNVGDFLGARDFSQPDAGVRLADSRDLPQTLRHLFCGHQQ